MCVLVCGVCVCMMMVCVCVCDGVCVCVCGVCVCVCVCVLVCGVCVCVVCVGGGGGGGGRRRRRREPGIQNQKQRTPHKDVGKKHLISSDNGGFSNTIFDYQRELLWCFLSVHVDLLEDSLGNGNTLKKKLPGAFLGGTDYRQ